MTMQTKWNCAAIGMTALLSACGGGDVDGVQRTAQTPDQESRLRAVALVAGDYPVLCNAANGASTQRLLSVGVDGRIGLTGRDAVDATGRDTALMISDGRIDGSLASGRILEFTLQHTVDATRQATIYRVRFDAPPTGPFAFAGMQYLDANGQAGAADCSPAEPRRGPTAPVQSLMVPLLGEATASMMCRSTGSNIPSRYQVELSGAVLTISNLTKTVRADLTQERIVGEVRYPDQADAIVSPNTGQVHHVSMADGSAIKVVRDRNGTLTEVHVVHFGGENRSALECRL